MDELLFHPKVVHLPIALGVLMPLVAAGLFVAWWRAWLPARAWVVAVVLQGVLVASGIVSLRTGEAAEERVEDVVAEQYIEQHEEAAQAFVAAGAVAFVIMGLGLAFASRSAGLPLAAAGTLATLVVLFLGYRTGEAGGALVYKHGAASAYTGANSVPAGEGAAQRGEAERADQDGDD